MNLVAPVRDYIDALVHPHAQIDPLRIGRHRNFIASRLTIGFLGIAILPIYLVARGTLTPIELFFFAWFLAPIAIGYFVSQTGYLRAGHVLWAAAFATLLVAAGAATGGFTLAIAVWLLLIPLEPALGSSRRVVFASALIAAFAAFLIAVMAGGARSAFSPHWVDVLAVVAAIAYATMLALSAELFAHKSSTLLAEEGERYSLLASNMNDVITRHGAGGAVLFASPAAQHTFGVSPDELSGTGIFDLVHVQDRPTYLSALAHAAAGATDASAEFRVRRNVTPAQAFSTGQFVWIEMRCRPLPGAATHLGGREVVAVMRDVTARKNQEDALAAARREADKANDAKSRFLATMSHELRTPLNAVIGFSEMLMEDRALGLDGDKRREYAGLIKNSGEHLLAVVNQVLDLSKIESGTLVVSPERCAPTPIVRSSCDLLALKAHEAKLEIQMRFDETIEEVSVDQRALKQMAINLISNAIKFTPPGGAVRVRTSIDHGMFVLSVEDNGIGIPAEDLGNIGSPFYQAQPSYDRRYEGTGLGLSIVKGLAELHGGRLDVASTVGVGTSVRVLIPRDGPPQKIESAQRAEVILLEPQHWSEPKVKQSA